MRDKIGIVSKNFWSSTYVAIEERSAADKTTAQAVLRKVPIAITQGWHGRGSVLQSAVRVLNMAATSPLIEAGLQQRLKATARAPRETRAVYGALPELSVGEASTFLPTQPLGSNRTSRRRHGSPAARAVSRGPAEASHHYRRLAV